MESIVSVIFKSPSSTMPKHFTVTFLFIGIGLHAMHSPNQITKTGSNQLDFKEHMIRIIEDKFHRLPSLKVEFHDVDDPGIVDQIAFVPSNRSTIRRARNFGDGTFGLILGSYGLLHSNQSYIFREGNLRIRFYSEHQAATIDSRLLESLAWDVDMMMDPKMTERMSRIEIFFVVNRIPIGDIPSRSHPRILSAWDWLFRNRWDHDLKEQIRIYMGPTMRPEDNKVLIDDGIHDTLNFTLHKLTLMS